MKSNFVRIQYTVCTEMIVVTVLLQHDNLVFISTPVGLRNGCYILSRFQTCHYMIRGFLHTATKHYMIYIYIYRERERE
jgi:hypothetical protein